MDKEATNRAGSFFKYVSSIVVFSAAFIAVFGGMYLAISKIIEINSRLGELTAAVEGSQSKDGTETPGLRQKVEELLITVETLKQDQTTQNSTINPSVNGNESGAQNDIVQPFSQTGSVRCPGGGDFLGRERNRRSGYVVLRAPEGRKIVPNSAQIQTIADNDGWHDPIELNYEPGTQNIKEARVRIFCDPPNYPGAGGGWMNIILHGQHTEINNSGR